MVHTERRRRARSSSTTRTAASPYRHVFERGRHASLACIPFRTTPTTAHVSQTNGARASSTSSVKAVSIRGFPAFSGRPDACNRNFVASRYTVIKDSRRLSEASTTRPVTWRPRRFPDKTIITRFYLGHGEFRPFVFSLLSSSCSSLVNYNISRRNSRSTSPARQPVETGRTRKPKKTISRGSINDE